MMLPMPEDYADDDRERSKLSRRSAATVCQRIWVPLWAVILVSCLITFIALLIVPSPFVGTTSTSVATAPHEAPSAAHSDLDRRRFIAFRISLARVSEPSVFVNPTSPQSQALKWLVYQDKTINIPDGFHRDSEMNTSQLSFSDDFHWKLVQRYALMVLYFSTSGAAWRGIVPWEDLVNTDECHSHFQGIGCDEVSGKVTTVALEYRKLGGRIPDEIGTGSATLELLSGTLKWKCLPCSVFCG
jgi:hypothetical protein